LVGQSTPRSLAVLLQAGPLRHFSFQPRYNLFIQSQGLDGKDGGIRVTHDTVALCLGDLRTLVGQRIEGITDFEALGMCDKCLGELVVDPSLDIDARSSTAALAMIEARRGMSTRLTMKVSADKIP